MARVMFQARVAAVVGKKYSRLISTSRCAGLPMRRSR